MLKSKSEIIDYGDIKEGVTLKGDFEVTNVGTTDLQLVGVSSSCGCTVPELDLVKMSPNETVKVKFTLNTKNRKGNVMKTIHIKYIVKNDVIETLNQKIKTNVLL